MVGVIEEGSGLFMARVGFEVPRGTAVILVHLENGQTFVQRPIVGTGAMMLDLGASWIDYVEALDPRGNVLMRDEVGDPPPGIGSSTTTTFVTTTTEVVVTDPVLHVSGASTRYFTTGEVLVEGSSTSLPPSRSVVRKRPSTSIPTGGRRSGRSWRSTPGSTRSRWSPSPMSGVRPR